MTSKLDHPNVLNLIGVSINTKDASLLMIMPFMHNGDVKSFLKSKRGNKIEFNNYPKVPIATYVHVYLKFTVRTLVMYIIYMYVIDFDLYLIPPNVTYNHLTTFSSKSQDPVKM